MIARPMNPARALGMDRPVFFAVSARLWSAAAGLVTALLVAAHFSPPMQGYYYTFSALAILRIFAEFGLAGVLLYHASHEWVHLSLDARGRPTGDPDALSRLIGLGRFALRWYASGAGVLMLILGALGLMFLASAGDPGFSWRAPWIALCLTTGFFMCMSPVWALLTGCNQVSNVFAYRFAETAAGSIAAWLAISLGAGLWTVPITVATSLAVSTTLIVRRYRGLLWSFVREQPAGPTFSWRRDLWPMQWRIAYSWIAGGYVYSLYTPMLFHFHGAVVAGQFGMTWALASMLQGLAVSWLRPQAPVFGMLVSQRKYDELDRAFARTVRRLLAVGIAGAVAVWLGLLALEALRVPLATRLLPPGPTALLLAAAVALVQCQAITTYLRAHRKDPLTAAWTVNGLLALAVALVLARAFSAPGVAVGHFVVALVALPLFTFVWLRRRAEWHAP
jgi:hypothetical protein